MQDREHAARYAPVLGPVTTTQRVASSMEMSMGITVGGLPTLFTFEAADAEELEPAPEPPDRPVLAERVLALRDFSAPPELLAGCCCSAMHDDRTLESSEQTNCTSSHQAPH